MFENLTLGRRTRHVRPYANRKNRQKRVLAQNYAAILAFTLIVALTWQPKPANAADFLCLYLFNNGNRITSARAASWTTGSSFNNRPVNLANVRDYCHDTADGNFNGAGANILATRAIQVSESDDYTDYHQSWDMSQVASQLGCPTANSISFPGMNQIISLLPQSPSGMRIPTLISNMAGQNSLAGNLAIELYSGVWQFLGILASFKLFKVFRG